MTHDTAILDGNKAAASVACRLNEVIAIYPITPASPMGGVGRPLERRKTQEHLVRCVPSSLLIGRPRSAPSPHHCKIGSAPLP